MTNCPYIHSAVFILAALLTINNETLKDFNNRSLQIAQGKARDEDTTKMNPWICESHAIHSVVLKAKKLCKAWQVGIAVYCFVILARSTTLRTLTVLYTAVHTLMSSKMSDVVVTKAFKLIQKTMQHLNITNIHAAVEEFIASENTDTTVLWSIDNDEKILEASSNGILDILPSEPRKSAGGDYNRYYMPDFLQYLRNCWINCFGLWTAILRGDLDRHQNPTEGPPELDNLDFPSNRTDGDIEQVINV